RLMSGMSRVVEGSREPFTSVLQLIPDIRRSSRPFFFQDFALATMRESQDGASCTLIAHP
ncbi:MAG: hypothetical protein ACXW61_15610, partial [Gemmatirosa sp.]